MKCPIYLALAVAISIAPAFAQGPGRFAPGGPGGPHERPFGPGGFGPGIRHGKVVTGAPYSADFTNESIKQLSDGNTISHTVTGKVARDSQGRTYEQETITAGPFAQNGPITLTFISDPVAGYSYVLNSSRKVAIRRPIHQNANASRPAPPAGAPSASRHAGTSPNVVETDLGSTSVGGVMAQGKRITHTVPAGAIGNAQPMVSTYETWDSPDLQIVVKAVRTDPQMGTSTYTLSNIATGKDPDQSLFQVPADYTVKDASAMPGPHGGPRSQPQ
ncbi:MAG: hypothetical protein JOZ62_02250 [Acidobacteriaceae bacterium]|nr:hypothetical protein [Acidobacteriaceae bacterium]